jgi:hypothetical protein
MNLHKGSKHRPVMTVKKMKGKVPTVIEISGRRYVYEPEGKRR